MNIFLESISQIAQSAGVAIMAHYRKKGRIRVSYKGDHSPVTEADLDAHQVIKAGLASLTPLIPVISEEDLPEWGVRRQWQRYWLVDPLDGTKGFIHHTDEFTVNIALIEQGKPVLGVIYVPTTDVLYFADHRAAWKKEKTGNVKRIQVKKRCPLRILVGRSQDNGELENYLSAFESHQITSLGSSLKFCLLAEGQAQLYPRFCASSVWDTAAGHSIALAAGAKVTDWNGQSLSYEPRESFLNPGFKVFVP